MNLLMLNFHLIWSCHGKICVHLWLHNIHQYRLGFMTRMFIKRDKIFMLLDHVKISHKRIHSHVYICLNYILCLSKSKKEPNEKEKQKERLRKEKGKY